MGQVYMDVGDFGGFWGILEQNVNGWFFGVVV
jgi:hypothetical protein